MAQVYIRDNEEEGSQCAFEEIIMPLWPEIKMLGLATGSTPIKLYGLLVWAFQRGLISLADLLTINLDEYVGLTPGHPESYWTFMWDHLFKWVDVKRENIMIPFGGITSEEKLTEVCLQMEKWIEDKGPVSLWILGIGENAHIGFCEPGTSVDSRYHLAGLAESTREANKRFFGGNISLVPEQAITAGIGTIKEGRHILQMAWGSQKEWADSASLLGPMTAWVPSSLLQDHPNLYVVLDREAGRGILNFIREHKLKPNDEDIYLITSEAGITHQVRVDAFVRNEFSLPRNYPGPGPRREWRP